MPSEVSDPLLEVRGLTKRFPGVRALQNVHLILGRGEVLAVIGENGAGKSTLMKILAGVDKPDEGAILLDGKTVLVDSVRTAARLGIVLIHQELNLPDNLDVGANIFLGREPHRFGWIDKKRIRKEALKMIELIDLDCRPEDIVATLSIGRQQMVEIAKALSVNARVLIMDEPTSSLSQHETERLYRLVKDLRSRGVSIIYISHRLGEVKELADRVLVLRDGRNAGELGREEIHHDRMVQLMVGREIIKGSRPAGESAGGIVLEVERLRTPAHPDKELTFRVAAGEMVGVAGLVGAGRSEMLQTLFGVVRAAGGIIRILGRPVVFRNPRDAIEAGIALVPEDRKLQGVVLEMVVRENLSLASLRRDQRRGFLDRAAEANLAQRTIRDLRIKTPGTEQVVQYLSGGNQQKVVLGKWLALHPKVLLLDEPTRGVDVGAKQEIYKLIEDLARRGVAILFVSSEMEEILRLSDRALIMHQGRISGELSREELSEENIMQLATGRDPRPTRIG